MEVNGEWRPPQMEQPSGYVRAEPHTQAQGGLWDGPPGPLAPTSTACSLFLPGCARTIAPCFVLFGNPIS